MKSEVKKYVVPFFVSHFSCCSVLPLANKLDQSERRESLTAFKAGMRRAKDEENNKTAKKILFQE